MHCMHTDPTLGTRGFSCAVSGFESSKCLRPNKARKTSGTQGIQTPKLEADLDCQSVCHFEDEITRDRSPRA